VAGPPTAGDLLGDAEKYRRYALTENGISPMGVAGFDPDALYRHRPGARTRRASPNYTPAMHTAQMDKRGVKFERVAELLCELGTAAGLPGLRALPRRNGPRWVCSLGARRPALLARRWKSWPPQATRWPAPCPGGDQPACRRRAFATLHTI